MPASHLSIPQRLARTLEHSKSKSKKKEGELVKFAFFFGRGEWCVPEIEREFTKNMKFIF